nr:PREDICTED: protein CutA homolog isoform X1 [Bemisia tabaci]
MLYGIQPSLKAVCAIGIPSLAYFLLPAAFNQTVTTMSTNAAGQYSMAFVTIDNEENAKKLAKSVVTNQLAACVNIVPKILSIYKWEGEIQEDSELLLLMKTRTSLVDELIAHVKANHPYKVCKVITTTIDKGNPDYLSWISDVVPERK